MADTLPFVPIVGYIEKNKDNDDDFSDHRQSISLKSGKLEIEYLCHAYGFISNEPNAQIEYKGGKEWLTAEGYLWTKFTKSIDIFDDADGSKGHSMEIEDVEGFVDEDGIINVEDAKFSALCILGDYVAPAMAGSTVEYFSTDTIKEEMKQMFMEFSQKGVQDLDKPVVEKNLEPEVTEPTVEEPVVEPEAENAEPVAEPENFNTEGQEPEGEDGELEEPESDVADPEDNSEPVTEPEDPEEPKSDKFQLRYSLSHEDVRSKLYEALYAEDSYGWINQTFDDKIIYEVDEYHDGSWSYHYFSRGYKISDDKVLLDSEKTEVFAEFLTQSEVDQVEANRSRITELETELSELKMAKNEAEKVEKESLIDSYSAKLDEKDKKELLDSISKFSVSDLEKEIAYKLFKQNDVTPTNSTVATNFAKGDTDGRYGDLDRLFHK